MRLGKACVAAVRNSLERLNEFNNAGVWEDISANAVVVPSSHEVGPISRLAAGTNGQALQGRWFSGGSCRWIGRLVQLGLGKVAQGLAGELAVVDGQEIAGGAGYVCRIGGCQLDTAGSGGNAIFCLESGESVGSIHVCSVLCKNTEE